MKLSVFTTLTNPVTRGDNYLDALDCYQNLADEVVVINGGRQPQSFNEYHFGKMTFYDKEWPQEFTWEFIGQQFQKGYEACTGDWALHADLDFIFHENDYKAIRKACEDNPDAPALSFWKYQFILPDRYTLKSRLVLAVNKKKFGDRIRFDSGGDLCQPSLDGKEIKPDSVPEARVPFYNYDFLIKSKDQVTDDVGRMDRAYNRAFGKWLYSQDGTEESAYNGWLRMMLGRLNRPHQQIPITSHPAVMQETIRSLQPHQCGYSLFGNTEPCLYYINNSKEHYA